MSIWLVMQTMDGKERPFALRKDRTIIGRENGCDVRIPVPAVSQKHCEIELDNGRIRLKDLGSDRGTFHNDKRVEVEEELTNADTLTIGPVTFVIRMEDELLPDGESGRNITVERRDTPPGPTIQGDGGLEG
jgi:pSer/pThr/pTyr-binding forkhead associated (FHA) protein